MAPKKLTEADKAAILGLYRQPEETTSTLAERYGVSNSTISRLLKASLPEAEYKTLIQQKRGTGDRDLAAAAGEVGLETAVEAPVAETSVAETSVAETSVAETSPKTDPTPEPEAKPEGSKAPPILKKRGTAEPVAPEMVSAEPTAAESADPAFSGDDSSTASRSGSTRRKRSRGANADPVSTSDPEITTQLTLTAADPAAVTEAAPDPAPEAKPPRPAPVKKTAAKAAPPEDDWVEDSPTLDDDYAEDDEDDEDDEDWEGDASEVAPHLEVVEIVPLTPSDLPSQCYLVVERASSELVVLPLKTFASLGQIPDEEGDHRTLPVFDNHRVARRFSRRNQRVIKVPDGSLLQTTRPYLQAKGITRLLIDGHVFALEDTRESMAEITP